MSVTLDTPDAISAAKARVASASGRHAVASRRKRGTYDPQAIANHASELNAAVIARSIITSLDKRPNLTVPHRLELIGLLMPSDSTEADQVLHELACESRGIST